MSKVYKDVGRVRSIYRYPVKSMAGECCEEVKIGWHGLAGDRRFGYVRVGSMSGDPWLSARDWARMVLYSARFVEPGEPETSPIMVTTPTGCMVPHDSAELIAEISTGCGGEVRLMQLYRGMYDSMDVSLITTASIQSLADRVGGDMEVERFRPNLLIEAFDERQYPEDRWVDELLVFGERDTSARLRANRKDLRCMIVNLDPKTAQQNPSILREIVSGRKNLLGIYGSTERPGTVRVGDVIRLVQS